MEADDAAREQRERWHRAEAAEEGRLEAGRACAELRDGRLKGRPHLVLACGHLSPPGNGPLAEAGWGWCDEHGVARIEGRESAAAPATSL